MHHNFSPLKLLSKAQRVVWPSAHKHNYVNRDCWPVASSCYIAHEPDLMLEACHCCPDTVLRSVLVCRPINQLALWDNFGWPPVTFIGALNFLRISASSKCSHNSVGLSAWMQTEAEVWISFSWLRLVSYRRAFPDYCLLMSSFLCASTLIEDGKRIRFTQWFYFCPFSDHWVNIGRDIEG